jgi:hypothetical protein
LWDDVNKELEIGGDIQLDDGGTYTTTVQTVTPTANRTISFPDATGTVALVGGSSGQLTYNNAGAYAGVSTMTFDGTSVTLAGRLINSYTSLASSPAKVFTGAWATGFGATNTKPHFLIEPSGTTSTGWNNSGTALGVNAASGFAGNLLDLQVNGTSRASVSSAGVLSAGSIAPAAFNVVNPLGTTGISSPSFPSGNFVDFHGIRRSSSMAGFVGSFALYGGSGNFDLNVVLQHEGANIFAQRNGTNAQTCRIYNTYTNDSNYERGFLRWNSNVFEVGPEAAGTGTARPMRITAATLKLPNLPTYADNAAATTGGLVAGDVYKTATGELRITV